MNIKGLLKNRSFQTTINLVTSIVTLIITTLIGFFLSPFIVRTLGEEANGFTQLANNFITYASLLTIALNSMAGRFITVSYYQGDKKACNKYYSSIIVGNAVIMITLLLPAIICVWKLESIINISNANVQHLRALFSFAFGSFFISQITGVFNISCYVKNSIYIQNLTQMVSSILRAVLLILAFALLPIKMYYVSAVGFILAMFNLAVAFVIKRRIFSDISFNPKDFDIRTVGQLVASGIWNTINQCGTILMTGLDLLLANIFVGAGPMGVLSVAKTIPAMVTQLCNSINTSFSPNQTISYSTNDNEEFVKNLNASSKISCAIVSIPLMVFCVFSYEFYKLWQPTLDASMLSKLSILTLLTYIPVCGIQVLYNVFTATNKLKLSSITFLITGAVSSIVTIIVVKYTSLGILAVAGISSIFSILRNIIFTAPYVSKITGKRWFYYYKDVLLSLVSCGIVGGISYLILLLLSPSNWIILILGCGISALLSLVANALIILNKNQRRAIINKILRKKSKEI